MTGNEQQLQELADRLAIRDLIDQYAYCAESRDAQGQMTLFTEDMHFAVYMDSTSEVPSQELHSRADLFPVFDHLNSYEKTMHFNGQSNIRLKGETTATAITYCMAYHLKGQEKTKDIVMVAMRYEDVLFKKDAKWLFAERKLWVDWIEKR